MEPAGNTVAAAKMRRIVRTSGLTLSKAPHGSGRKILPHAARALGIQAESAGRYRAASAIRVLNQFAVRRQHAQHGLDQFHPLGMMKVEQRQTRHDGLESGDAVMGQQRSTVPRVPAVDVHARKLPAKKSREFGIAFDYKQTLGRNPAIQDRPGDGAGSRSDFKNRRAGRV